MLQIWFKALLFLLIPSFAYAGQIISIQHNGEGMAQIARTALNRIYIEQDSITQVVSLNGELMIQKDLENGQMFVKPNDESREKPIEVFISTEKGYHFALSLKPLTVKSQNIGIHIGTDQPKIPQEDKAVLSFITQMQQREFDTASIDKSLDIGLSFEPYKTIKKEIVANDKYQGEIILIANEGDELLSVDQNQFRKEGVKAIGIEKDKLQSGEATKVFVVRSYG